MKSLTKQIMRFKLSGASYIGQMHIDKNMANQDAFCAIQIKNGQHSGYLIAVADGHGHAIHKYSEAGAKIAIRVMARIAKKTLPLFVLDDEALLKINRDLRANWLKYVLNYHHQHYADEPFSPLLYGTTLRFCLCNSDGQALLGSVGDGITALLDDNVENISFFEDCHSQNMDLPTNSLCTAGLNDVKLKVVDIQNISFVIIASDGLDTGSHTAKNIKNHCKKYLMSASDQTLNNNLAAIAKTYSVGNNLDDSTVVILKSLRTSNNTATEVNNTEPLDKPLSEKE